jgi:hypothetical protein
MKRQLRSSNSDQLEVFLSGAYERIRRTTIILSAAAVVVLTPLLGWRTGLGFAFGSAVAYINLVWLHHASAIMTERMIATPGKPPSKLRSMLAFFGRYIFVIAISCAILKGLPSMRFGFTMALFSPILAATCEGIYEALVNGSTNEISQ